MCNRSHLVLLFSFFDFYNFVMNSMKMIKININNFWPRPPAWGPAISSTKADLDKRRWRRPRQASRLARRGTRAGWSHMCLAVAAPLCRGQADSTGSLGLPGRVSSLASYSCHRPVSATHCQKGHPRLLLHPSPLDSSYFLCLHLSWCC